MANRRFRPAHPTAWTKSIALAVALVVLWAVPQSAWADRNAPRVPTIDGASAHYTVSLADRANRKWGVSVEFRGLNALRKAEKIERNRLTLRMPNWSPGAYEWGNYGRHVDALYARVPQGPMLRVENPAHDTWHITLPADADAVRVSYQTTGAGGYVTGGLHNNHADFLGTALFVYVNGTTNIAGTIRFTDLPQGWHVFTAMPETERENEFAVRDYDHLVDSPTAFGPYRKASFQVGGKTIEIVVCAAAEVAEMCHERVLEPTRKIVQAHLDMMGELPFEKYLFIFYVRNFGFGGAGLEHDDSTQIWSSASAFRGNMWTLLTIIAHEFFHLWNVRRLRAAPINPYDYQNLPDIDCLWFHEGVTSYYTDVLLARAGLTTTDEFYGRMTGMIGRHNRTRDYYLRGEVFGFLLDCLVRHHTNNEKSFDDVFRTLWERYGKTRLPFDQTAEIARVTSEIAGVDLTWFFDEFILSDKPTPIADILRQCHIPFTGYGPGSAYLGFDGQFERGQILVTNVLPFSPAAQAGLQNGDLIRRLDGAAVHAGWQRTLSNLPAWREISITFERDGETRTLSVTAGASFQSLRIDVPAADSGHRASQLMHGITAPDTPRRPRDNPDPNNRNNNRDGDRDRDRDGDRDGDREF